MILGRSVCVIVVALAVSMVAQFGHAGFRSNAVGVVAYPPTGVDTDGDGTDDANDTDIDGDGLVNSIPLPLPTDADACPYLSDCDFDGLADADDGAPQNPDLDGDGVLDGADPDIDGDGIANAADSNSFDSSIGGDTDGDGYDDAREVADGTDPNVDQTVLDTDGDGTNDHAEILAGTDPNVNELTAIAQFASTPFTVDCTTTPGTCVVTGTVPTNATSVTVNGAQTGTSATASQVATISGGQFTATFTGLDHTASWDFTATASGGTGVTDVVSSAVAMTPTQPAAVIAQFASTPFTVDCTTTPGTCVVTGTVPTNATSVTVNGAQTGTSATASQVATISGGQFTATFTGLDHTASWDFTATASGGTGVTDVRSTVVASTPLQNSLPALAKSTLRIDMSGTYNKPDANGGFRVSGGSEDFYLAKNSTMRLTHPDGTVELEKVSGCRTDDRVNGDTYSSTWSGGCSDVYATLRARLTDGNGVATTQWVNITIGGWFGGNRVVPDLEITNLSKVQRSTCYNSGARRSLNAGCALPYGTGFHRNAHYEDYVRTESLTPAACTTTRYGSNPGYIFWTNPGDGVQSTCRILVYNNYGQRSAKTYGPNTRVIEVREPGWTVNGCAIEAGTNDNPTCANEGLHAYRIEAETSFCRSQSVSASGSYYPSTVRYKDTGLRGPGGSQALTSGRLLSEWQDHTGSQLLPQLAGWQGGGENVCVTFSD